MGAEHSQYAADKANIAKQIKDKIEATDVSNTSRFSNFNSQKSINMGPNFGSG